ncbi:hypothetical protein DFH06DRAFT_1191675 [Mycena polygramma]|nr:hypothetical protein DFH06DRAFT_1191675 [Mycena polygramma]
MTGDFRCSFMPWARSACAWQLFCHLKLVCHATHADFGQPPHSTICPQEYLSSFSHALPESSEPILTCHCSTVS